MRTFKQYVESRDNQSSAVGAWLNKLFSMGGVSDPKLDQPTPPSEQPTPPSRGITHDLEKTLSPEEARRFELKAGNKTTPPESQWQYPNRGVTDDDESVRRLLRILDGPVNALYPFLRQQIQGCIGGTPNFMSPEQASSTLKDPDNISNFMLAMKDVPFIYRQIKPVATAFQRFLNVYLKLHNAVGAQPMVWRQAENVEMKRRLDVRNFEKIMKDVESLDHSMNRVKMEKDFMRVMGYGNEVSMLLQEWERFNNLFQKAAPEIMRLLYQMYQGVKDKKWDKTGPYASKGPRGEEDADIGQLGNGVLHDPSSHGEDDGDLDMPTDKW